MLGASHSVGNPNAPIAVVEFSDLECPFCSRFHNALKSVQEKHPGKITYSFMHFPLSAHKHALRAARVAECANAAGKFAEAVDVIFANQDSLGKREWTWFMNGVSIPDTHSFARCLSDTTTPPMVREGLALGAKMKVAGTPTVFLNGWRYGGAPADTEIMRAVEDLLAGKKPYKGFPASALKAQ
jgi:protein-disulfide isomerase